MKVRVRAVPPVWFGARRLQWASRQAGVLAVLSLIAFLPVTAAAQDIVLQVEMGGAISGRFASPEAAELFDGHVRVSGVPSGPDRGGAFGPHAFDIPCRAGEGRGRVDPNAAHA